MKNPVAVKWVGKRGEIISTLDGIKYNFTHEMGIQVIPFDVLKNIILATGRTFTEIVPCTPEEVAASFAPKSVEEVVKEIA
jgi:hypothetical protein